jgi:hypothetical protein
MKKEDDEDWAIDADLVRESRHARHLSKKIGSTPGEGSADT